MKNQSCYADIICDKFYKYSFYEILDSTKYNTCFSITDPIRRNSTEKLCRELDLKALNLGSWLRKLCCFNKIASGTSPSCLFDLMHSLDRVHITRCSNFIFPIIVGHDYFKNSFFHLLY